MGWYGYEYCINECVNRISLRQFDTIQVWKCWFKVERGSEKSYY